MKTAPMGIGTAGSASGPSVCSQLIEMMSVLGPSSGCCGAPVRERSDVKRTHLDTGNAARMTHVRVRQEGGKE
jgi:hypothetical protein